MLVIDDYDFIAKEIVHESLCFFLDYQPNNVHVILISRTRPPLNVSRRLMQDEYIELLPHHFALDLSQSVALFNKTLSRKKLSGAIQENSDDAQLLQRLSQGWPAGIKMLALTAQQAGFSEDSDILYQEQQKNFIFSVEASDLMSDYFLEEVFTKLPNQTAEFLLHTAHLPKLTASLCDSCIQSVIYQKGEAEGYTKGQDLILPLKGSSKTILEQLQREGLFVEIVDTNRQTYRYHRLFQRFLREYSQKHIPEKISDLNISAAKWFYAHNDIEAALEQVMQLQDWGWAVQLLEESGQNLMNEGRYGNLKRSLQALPVTYIEDRPLLMLFYVRIWIHDATTHINPVPRYLKNIETILDNTKAALASGKTDTIKKYGISTAEHWFQFYGAFCFVSSYWARLHGAASQAEKISRNSLEIAVERDLPFKSPALFSVGMSCYLRGDLKAGAEAVEAAWRSGQIESNFEIVASAAVRLAWVYQWQGKFKAALQIYEQTRSWLITQQACSDLFICWQNLMLVAYYREQNQLDKATECLDAVLRAKGEDKKLALFAPFVHARLEESKGRYSEADIQLEQVEALYRPMALTMQGFPSVDAARAKLAVIRGDERRANEWLGQIRTLQDRAGESLLGSHRYRYEEVRITAARIMLMNALLDQTLLHEREIWVDEAIALLKDIEIQARMGSRVSNRVTCKILLSVAELCRNQVTDAQLAVALQTYGDAMSIGRESGYIRLFVEEFPNLQRTLLLKIQRYDLNCDYAEKLLTLIQEDSENLSFDSIDEPGTADKSLQKPNRNNRHSLSLGIEGVEPLSRREMDVLRLINRGLANKEIAGTLFVGLGTVKTHVRNILSKYSVGNRTQAVAKARQLGVIE